MTSSFAHERTDELSDLDISVVVRDSSVQDFVPAGRVEVERFGEVVWCQEVVGNAPPGGAYLGVGFAASGYPLCTDWYWQPLELAAFPTPALVLVEKTPVDRTPQRSMSEIVNANRQHFAPPAQSPDFSPVDPFAAKWTFRLEMFWRMSGVAASKYARGATGEADAICERLRTILGELSGSAALPDAQGFDGLRRLYSYAEDLVPQARELGAMIPADRTWVLSTIDFMDALVREGWRSALTNAPQS